jgi:hypothetical protein
MGSDLAVMKRRRRPPERCQRWLVATLAEQLFG